jgi:hypothetical protein
MNNAEAESLLQTELAKYRAKKYRELVGLVGTPQTSEVAAPSGTKYQLEIQALWDDQPNGVLRLVGAIDDRGARASLPLTESFLLSPSGEFVGE